MGYWNTLCTLTRTPILPGDRVLLAVPRDPEFSLYSLQDDLNMASKPSSSTGGCGSTFPPSCTALPPKRC